MDKAFMLFGPLVALITPFTFDGRVDFATFEKLLALQIEAGTKGIVLCGSTGESATVLDSEWEELISRAVAIAAGKLPIIAGTGSNSTSRSFLMTQRAKELGAAAALVVNPYYNRPNDEGCYLHYREVSKAALPLILYHNPTRTGRTFSRELMLKILQLEAVIGVKEASSNLQLVQDLCLTSKKPIVSGDDVMTLPIMKAGGTGVISVIGNLVPEQWNALVVFAQKGEFESAQLIYNELLPLIEAISLEPNPIGIKYALHLLGKCALSYRLPLSAPSKKNGELIAQAVEKMALVR